MNEIFRNRRDPRNPLFKCELHGMIFSRSLLYLGATIKIMPNTLDGKFKFGDLEPLILELR